MTDYAGYVYALLISGGGVAGYVNAGSVMSLVMGLLFGALAAAGAYWAGTSKSRHRYVPAFFVSASMGFRFGIAFVRTAQLWPTGAVAFASTFMLMRYLYGAYMANLEANRNEALMAVLEEQKKE